MTAVLLIDDHAMFREALLLSLSQALPGVTVHPASNGAEALAVLQAQPQIGSVIMDYYLPDLGGSALLKRLKQLRPGIRVLVLSASEDPDDRERVMAAGAQGFLHKSADCRALLDALEQIGQPPRADLAPAARRKAARADAGAGGRHGPAQRLDAAPGRGVAADVRRPAQPRDLRTPQHDREDREDPRHRHPGDAGRGQPDPGHAGRAARRIAGQAR